MPVTFSVGRGVDAGEGEAAGSATFGVTMGVTGSWPGVAAWLLAGGDGCGTAVLAGGAV